MGSSSSSQVPKFDLNTTSDQVMVTFGDNAKNKHAIVTGSNCGLGFETANSLAKHGSVVTVACRSKSDGEAAVAKIKKDFPNAQVSFLQLDLASFDSVRKFVADYKATNQPLHILVNNAGVMACPKALTSNGLEMQFGVNHIGHFILTTELLEVLKKSGTKESPAKVINLSSIGNWLLAPPQGIRFDDLKGDKYYNPWERYGSAKLANILFTNELDRRLQAEGANVMAVSLHPGAIMATKLARHLDWKAAHGMFSQMWLRHGAIYHATFNTLYKTIPQGICISFLL
jgi:retinol dehydrogenase-12